MSNDSNINATNIVNLTKEDLLAVANKIDKKDKDVLIDAVGYLLQNHVDNILKIRQEHEVKDQDLLSDMVLRVSQIPPEIKRQIADIQEKFRVVITTIAERIEQRKYRSAEKALEDIESLAMRKEANKLLNAEKKVHISCQTLKVTTEVFEKINRKILEELENYENQTNQIQIKRLALGNAIIVYELTNFVINYLESFQLEGTNEILKIKENVLHDINKNKLEDEKLKQEAEQENNNELVSSILLNIKAREDSYNLIIEEWDKYEKNLNDLLNNAGEINENLNSLKLIRTNAKNQLGFLELVEVVRALRGNLNAIENTIVNLEKMELITLSPDKVSLLLAPYFQ